MKNNVEAIRFASNTRWFVDADWSSSRSWKRGVYCVFFVDKCKKNFSTKVSLYFFITSCFSLVLCMRFVQLPDMKPSKSTEDPDGTGNLAMNNEWDLTQKKWISSKLRTLKKQLSFFPTSNHFTMRIWVIRLFGTSICWLTVRCVSRIKPGRGMTARLAPAVSNSVNSSTVNA